MIMDVEIGRNIMYLRQKKRKIMKKDLLCHGTEVPYVRIYLLFYFNLLSEMQEVILTQKFFTTYLYMISQ